MTIELFINSIHYTFLKTILNKSNTILKNIYTYIESIHRNKNLILNISTSLQIIHIDKIEQYYISD